MLETIIDRVNRESDYIIERKCTVRACAKIFHTSKSTVHKDVTERLSLIDSKKHEKVKKILERNLAERHIRGGNATKLKYLLLKK